MTKRMQCQIEMAGEAATLYVSGTLGRENTGTLVAISAGMPARIRTLRIDLRALGQVSADAMAAVRVLLDHWRQSRHAEFRLCTSHLVATICELAEVHPPSEPSFRPMYGPSRGLRTNDALLATFL
jgi:ABC-type transporter Mla MlaB component